MFIELTSKEIIQKLRRAKIVLVGKLDIFAPLDLVVNFGLEL